MGFNNEARKVCDTNVSLAHRFGALRRAVERFSPNGYHATFASLERAIGVTDSDAWTAEEMVRAVDLLSAARERYVANRSLWDEGRREHKARGLRDPTPEEQSAFADPSWFDDVSYHPKPRYRWVGLGEWVRAHELAPRPFGPEMDEAAG